jgi:hypothetical protein|tara:strand:- start:250 stop:438 length:189 start_codon:yes stop_codon:yes gene_type:complete
MDDFSVRGHDRSKLPANGLNNRVDSIGMQRRLFTTYKGDGATICEQPKDNAFLRFMGYDRAD